jgi:hypothetical protein
MNFEAIWPFYAGVVAQALFLLLGQFEWKDPFKVLACCAGSLLALIPSKHETHYSLNTHLLILPCVFAVGYAVVFKEKVLQRINKEILMVWTLVGVYIALQTPLLTSYPPVMLSLLALSLVPVINAFVGFDKYFGWKVYFYIWFLCVLVGIAASKFAFTTIANVFGMSHDKVEINSFTMFLIGMSFLYMVVNFWYVIELIPLPGKHQSFSDRMEEVEEDMEMMADDYDDQQVRWWKTMLLLTVSATLLALNYFRHFVSDETLIPILIAALPIVDKIRLPAKPPVQTINPTPDPASPTDE